MTDARVAGDAELAAAGALLERFNREFDEPSPPGAWLGERLRRLVGGGRTDVALAGDGPDGIAVVRYRPALWEDAEEAHLAELYVVPGRRRQGLGAALMTLVLDRARERGCAWIDLGTDEDDHAAHRLYRRFGFTDRAGDERMFVFERRL